MISLNKTPSGSNVSDYRDSPKHSLNSTVEANVQSNTQSKRMSFSSAVKSSAFPKKDQAVIFPVIEGLQVRDYVFATGELVDPKDMLFVSRMSNNRVCLYFSSKEIVNDFIEKHGGVEINGVFVPARKLILPAQRIIISNVQPFMSHEIIEQELKGKGLKLVSPVSFIGAGIGVDRYRHMCSFRRQVFVAVDQTANIPTSIEITFENEIYRVFLADDKVRCFKCKEEGHIAANCTIVTDDIAIPSTNKRPPPLTDETSDLASLEVQESCPDVVEAEVTNGSQKEPQSSRTNEVTEATPLPGIIAGGTKPKKQVSDAKSASKKIKLDKSLEPTESYEGLEKIWQDNTPKPLDYIHFTEFLTKVKGSNRPLEIARIYTDDMNGVLSLLKNAQFHTSQRPVKERCRRLVVSLKKALLKEGKQISSPPQSRSSSVQSRSSCVSSLNRSISQESLDEY